MLFPGDSTPSIDHAPRPHPPRTALAHRRRRRRHLHRHGAGGRRRTLPRLQDALGAGGPQPRGAGRTGARRARVRDGRRAPAVGLRAAPARLHRRHQHGAGGQRSAGGDAGQPRIPRLPGGPPRLPRRSLRPPSALPSGDGAALPAPAGRGAHGREGHRGRTARRDRPRRRNRDVPRGEGGVDRGLPPAQLRERRPRATVRRSAARAGRLRVGVALARGGAGHRRVRTRLHHRGQRLHRPQGGALPASARRAPARARASARTCWCSSRTGGRSRSGRWPTAR